MDTLIETLWNFLTPSIGTLALAAVGIGLAVGLMKKAIDKLGTTPVMLTIGGIVVVAWAVRYVARPPQVEVREIEKPVVVEKVVVDTSSVDAMKVQIEQMQRDKENMAVMVNDARKRAREAEAEIERRDAPKISARAAFDERYSEAKIRPTYEFVKKPHGTSMDYLLTVRECRKDYLVTSIYECAYSTLMTFDFVIITAQNRNMQPVGKSGRYQAGGVIFDLKCNEKGDIDIEALLDGLADGSVTIPGHDDNVDRHLIEVNERSEKLKQAEDAYIKRAQRGLE